MKCRCSHQSWSHGKVTYPSFREPCSVCAKCGQLQGEHRWLACQYKACPCDNFTRVVERSVSDGAA